MKQATWAQGRKRLLALATYLDTADEQHLRKGERTYKQELVVHPCGAPACAIGHYYAMNPKRFKLIKGNVGMDEDGSVEYRRGKSRGDGPSFSTLAPREFAITDAEVEELFEWQGCGGAKTAQMAAAYIRKFVARKDKARAKAKKLK